MKEDKEEHPVEFIETPSFKPMRIRRNGRDDRGKEGTAKSLRFPNNIGNGERGTRKYLLSKLS